MEKNCTKCNRPEHEQVGDKTVTFKVGSKICTICKAEQVAQWKKDNKDRVNKHQRDLRASKQGEQICFKCKLPKPKKDFIRYGCICRECRDIINNRPKTVKYNHMKVAASKAKYTQKQNKKESEIKVKPIKNFLTDKPIEREIEYTRVRTTEILRPNKIVRKGWDKQLKEIKERIANL